MGDLGSAGTRDRQAMGLLSARLGLVVVSSMLASIVDQVVDLFASCMCCATLGVDHFRGRLTDDALVKLLFRLLAVTLAYLTLML